MRSLRTLQQRFKCIKVTVPGWNDHPLIIWSSASGARIPTSPVSRAQNLKQRHLHLEFRQTNLQTITSSEIWRHQPELPKIISLPWQFCPHSHRQLPVPYCRVHPQHIGCGRKCGPVDDDLNLPGHGRHGGHGPITWILPLGNWWVIQVSPIYFVDFPIQSSI